MLQASMPRPFATTRTSPCSLSLLKRYPEGRAKSRGAVGEEHSEACRSGDRAPGTREARERDAPQDNAPDECSGLGSVDYAGAGDGEGPIASRVELKPRREVVRLIREGNGRRQEMRRGHAYRCFNSAKKLLLS